MARLRSAPVAQSQLQPQPQPSPPKAQNKRQALREKTNTSRAKAPVYENDGNTEDLVKNAKTRRGRPRKSAHNEDELVMAGGLGLRRTDSAEEPRSEAPMTTGEQAKSDAPPPTVESNRRPPRMTRKPIQNEAQSKVLEGLKKRMEATARKEAGRKDTLPVATESIAVSSDPLPTKPTAARTSTSTAHERSEYSISPSPPPPGKLSSTKRSSLAQSGTPAVESSILALKNFKRRPRQPSMLQMVQQRTASARPSAVNLAANEDPSVFDFEVGGDDTDEEDEDDFAPDAEGTPLHVSKAKRRASASAKKKQVTTQAAPVERRPAAVSRKRKSDEVDTSSSALDALRAKRQKSDAPGPALDDEPLATFERSVSPRRRSRESSDRQATPQQQITSDVQAINSSPSSTPPTEPSSDRHRTAIEDDYAVPSTEKEQEQDVLQPSEPGLDDQFEQDVPNGTMAEPASSSPSPDDPLSAQEQAEILAEPVTQVTQQSPVRKRKESKKKAKPVSTATLQSLLPKRRQPPKARHRKTEYDFTSDDEDEDVTLDASHLEDDEDELGGRLRRQKKSTPAKSRKSTAAKAKGRPTKATQHARKSSAAPAARKPTAVPQSGKKPNRTYGRAANTASDKENEGDDFEPADDGDGTDLPEVALHEVAGSKELEVAKRKFAEVDEWDMEFESMSVEDHRSSSQQWR